MAPGESQHTTVHLRLMAAAERHRRARASLFPAPATSLSRPRRHRRASEHDTDSRRRARYGHITFSDLLRRRDPFARREPRSCGSATDHRSVERNAASANADGRSSRVGILRRRPPQDFSWRIWRENRAADCLIPSSHFRITATAGKRSKIYGFADGRRGIQGSPRPRRLARVSQSAGSGG